MDSIVKVGDKAIVGNELLNLVEGIKLEIPNTSEPSIKPIKLSLYKIEEVNEYLKGYFVRGGFRNLNESNHRGVFDCIKIVDNKVTEAFIIEYCCFNKMFYLLVPNSEGFKDFWLGEHFSDFYLQDSDTIKAITYKNGIYTFKLI